MCRKSQVLSHSNRLNGPINRTIPPLPLNEQIYLLSLSIFFWVIPRWLNFIYRSFGTHCLFHIQIPMKMERSVHKRRHIKFRRRGITQKKTHHSVHGQNLKLRLFSFLWSVSAINQYAFLHNCIGIFKYDSVLLFHAFQTFLYNWLEKLNFGIFFFWATNELAFCINPKNSP